jgi:hypothetical protein
MLKALCQKLRPMKIYFRDEWIRHRLRRHKNSLAEPIQPTSGKTESYVKPPMPLYLAFYVQRKCNLGFLIYLGSSNSSVLNSNVYIHTSAHPAFPELSP